MKSIGMTLNFSDIDDIIIFW